MTSAVKALGIDSHQLTAVSPRFNIVLRRFSRTVLSLRADAPRPLYRTSVALVLRRAAPGVAPRGGLVMKALTIIGIVAAALVALTGPAAAQIQLGRDRGRDVVNTA